MKTKEFTKFVRAVALAATMAFTFAASAETFYWKADPAEFGDFGTLSNWSTEGIAGADAERLPGEGDELYGPQGRSIDLGGRDVVVSTLDSTALWDRYTTNLKNGSLKFVGHVWTHSFTLKLTEGAKVWYDCEYRSSQGHGAADEIFIADGCEWKMTGTFNNYKLETHIAAGGKAILDPTYFGIFWGSAQNSYFDVAGELDLPNGINWQSGSFSDAGNSFDFRLQDGGRIKLGGNFTRNEAVTGRLLLSMAGGTLEATGDVAFSGVEATVSAQTDFKVDEGATLDFGGVTFGDYVAVSKTGEGMAVFSATMPSTLYLWGGDITIAAPNLTFAGSVSGDSPSDVKIAAKGFTFAAEVHSTVNFSIDPSVFAVGDVILTSDTPGVLAKAAEDLQAVGISTKTVGNQLELAPSEIVFNSTTITDLNDPDGWKGKSVPGAGVAVTIAGEGVNAIVTAAIPAFASITVSDGATLKLDLDDADIPAVKLENDGRLVVSKTAEIAGFDGAMSKAVDLNAITVDAGATLGVPGNTRFRNCTLDLRGSIVGTSDGKLVFGYAEAGETASFGMTADGATITALNAAVSENASRIEFACPAEGGTVKVVGEGGILLKDTTITYNSKDGMAFGLNNPASEAFTVTADNTPLDVGADTYVAGGANLVLLNSRLLRKRHSEGDTGDSNYNLIVRNRGRITVGQGGSIYAGVTRVNNDTTNGAIRLEPDEEGYYGLVFTDGGTAHWYKLDGENKGAIDFEGETTFEFTKSFWWGWGNRSHVFNRLKAVNIGEGGTLSFKCVKESVYSSNADTYTYFIMESPFSGAGDLAISNTRSSQTFQPTFVCGDNTCTGTLSVDDSNTLVHFADGANWAGKVVLNGKIDLVPVDTDHPGASGAPATVTFGAAELAADFSLRLWGKTEKQNDVINLTGEGWLGAGELVLLMQDGYEPQPDDRWLVGRIPAASALPKLSEKWQFYKKAVEGDETLVDLYVGPASVNYNFISTTSTDLNDPEAWECGHVPVGKEVAIVGAGVVAAITDAATIPAFKTISVKSGATLFINASGVDSLPPLTIDATSRVIVGADEDVAEEFRPSLTLPNGFVTTVAVDDTTGEFVSMSKVIVERSGVLIVPTGSRLKNVDLEVYGTLKSSGSGGEIVFGHANALETAYFAFKAEGAVINFPGAENGGIRTLSWIRPEESGIVKPVGTLVFKDVNAVSGGWSDYYTHNFCKNNPEDVPVDFTWDNSVLLAPYDVLISGGARMEFVNGGRIARYNAFSGMWVDIVVEKGASLTFDGADTGLWLITNVDCWFKVKTTEAFRTVVTLKNGASLNARRVGGENGAVVAVPEGEGVLSVPQVSEYSNHYDLYNGVTVDVGAGAQAVICANSSLSGVASDIVVTNAVAFKGTGDVRVRNGFVDRAFDLTLSCTFSTCTGTLGVDAAAEGDTGSVLRLANGFSWGGEVVYDDAVFVDGNGGAPVSLTLGSVDLEKDLPIRVWISAKGRVTNDKVNLTGAGFTGGGRAVIEVQGEEDLPTGKAFYSLGTLPKGAALPKLRGSHYRVVTREIEGDDSHLEYGFQLNSGFVIHVF